MGKSDIQILNDNILSITKTQETKEIIDKLTIVLQPLIDASNLIAKEIKLDFLQEQIDEYLYKAKEDAGLSQLEFEEKYLNEKADSENLGRNGWVVTEYGNPREVSEWNTLLKVKAPEKIVEYFEGDYLYVFTSIIDNLSKKYINGADKIYFGKSYDFYIKEDYMSSAMYLVGLIEQRCKSLINFGDYKKYNKMFSEKGFEIQLNKHFKNVSGHIVKRFLFLQMYPSLISFLNRLFVDGDYKFENGIEPPYINRNWLLHGRSTRKIEKYECIQLFNALSVLEFVCELSEKK
ncbi:hypothetical protein [Pseudobutyrivibrio xylanivorans]|uniref:Uncharacterized protein n=1 Tax=Pseudobutyrivibrio xylanivorans TaxID=185007 RepID=A0A5P6VUV5_PSEXY|nr:hypothetical protein [Pseudobutyrivibrio xylanivorans]QFJ56018.1 hypothetical protein FXF36_14525 [Pseudobutyrivibrio xylanivorans]